MTRLLLLEDDPDLADSVEMILSLDGHEVHATANGRQALLWAAREPWDLAILDVDVDELSGVVVASAIDDFRGSPTLVMSASAGNWQQDAFAAGAVACVRKPFDSDDLRALVRMLLAEPQTRRETRVTELSEADLARLRSLTPQELDELAYGVIRVDRNGLVVDFNAYEVSASRLPRERVVGRPFAELAPCTQVREFAGAIASGIAAGKLDRVVRFVFPAHHALTLVTVRLYFDIERQNTWIFVSRRAPTTSDRRAAVDEGHP